MNVDATEALLRQAKQAGVSRLVYTSSASVYGRALVPADRAVWVDEQLVPRGDARMRLAYGPAGDVPTLAVSSERGE